MYILGPNFSVSLSIKMFVKNVSKITGFLLKFISKNQ